MGGEESQGDAKSRIRDALVAVVGVNGYSGESLGEALERAGVAWDEFDEIYTSREECLVECWVGIMREQFWPSSEAAFAKGGDDWRESLRYQAWDLVRFVEDDPFRTRFLIEVPLVEEGVQANRDLAMARIADNVHLGRFEREEGPEVSRATAEALVGAVWNGVAQNIQPPVDMEAVHGGAPLILYLTMMAYLGQEAAQEEVRRGPEDLERYKRGEL